MSSDAKVIVAGLNSLTINTTAEGKTLDEIHPLVRDIYLQNGYHNLPETKNGPRAAFGDVFFHYVPDEVHGVVAEANPAKFHQEQLMRDFMSGEKPIPWENLGEEMEAIMADATIGSGLTLNMMPGRYHYEQAMRDYAELRRNEGRPLTWEESKEMGPRNAHVSCIFISRYIGPTCGYGPKAF